MPRGFDSSTDCTAIAPSIKTAGYDFVCRYYSHNPRKNLSQGEANSLAAAGVAIVTVWEDEPKYDAYFTQANGVADGASAYRLALQIGQPAGSAIYFAVDYDVDPALVGGPISTYFQGVAASFATLGDAFSIGIYGSGAACGGILAAGLCRYTWLAQSPAWRGTAGYGGWNICQGMGATLLGIGVDLDSATDDCGSF